MYESCFSAGWFAEIPEAVDPDEIEYHQFYVGKVSLNNGIMVFHNHFLREHGNYYSRKKIQRDLSF